MKSSSSLVRLTTLSWRCIGFLTVVAVLTPVMHSQATQLYTNTWSGYLVAGPQGTVTQATGSWTVPAVTCGLLETSYSVFWIGIDGAPSVASEGDLEQIGTASNCIRGTPTYYAWYEFLPKDKARQTISNFPIEAGDQISAEVSHSATDQFTVTITDARTGKTYPKTASVTGAKLASAEWIAEDPTNSNQNNPEPLPFANFGTVAFGSDNTAIITTVSPDSLPIGAFEGHVSVDQITMTTDGTPNGTVEAEPSPLSMDQSSFSVERLSGGKNTWSIPTQMPIAVGRPSIAVLENQIYLVGGGTPNGNIANMQIYNPDTNEWSTGTSLPVATASGCGAVVRNKFYFIGGDTTGHGTYTGAVWIYSPKTKQWTSGAPMPTAREGAFACVAENNIIYVMGGYNVGFLNTDEAYDPATNSWTEEASMLSAESDLMGGGLVDNMILVANGSDGEADTHNQGYTAATNSWEWLPSDPTTRQGTCVASIGPLLYSAGGWLFSEVFNLTESFNLSTGAWTTLASMPQAAGDPSGVAYKGRLYCFGGNDNNGNVLNIVQIYQP